MVFDWKWWLRWRCMKNCLKNTLSGAASIVCRIYWNFTIKWISSHDFTLSRNNRRWNIRYLMPQNSRIYNHTKLLKKCTKGLYWYVFRADYSGGYRISSKSSIVCNNCALPRILKSFKLTRWRMKFLQSFSWTILSPYSRTKVLQASEICRSAIYLKTERKNTEFRQFTTLPHCNV